MFCQDYTVGSIYFIITIYFISKFFFFVLRSEEQLNLLDEIDKLSPRASRVIHASMCSCHILLFAETNLVERGPASKIFRVNTISG